MTIKRIELDQRNRHRILDITDKERVRMRVSHRSSVVLAAKSLGSPINEWIIISLHAAQKGTKIFFDVLSCGLDICVVHTAHTLQDDLELSGLWSSHEIGGRFDLDTWN
ncbi:hypothetical protein PoB_003494300 [Plakobranchus ocellatus]|uniref:Uncharacterized protein n=1 Tax=Plakobranchus ocellatus TaxID=259542 RepID=A0AAV4AMB8_9GAST|nr:hypothetical protein PoB_003494300 [Plakobranchus ocellatus]